MLSQQILSYFECCFIPSAIFVNENKKNIENESETNENIEEHLKNGNEKMQNEKTRSAHRICNSFSIVCKGAV